MCVKDLDWIRSFVRSFIRSFVRSFISYLGARCSSVLRASAHGAMGRRIDLLWWTH